MLIGYARTSTADQTAGLAAQERDLRGAGAERLFMEQVSSVADRPKLAEALDYVREGDVLLASKPDRLARSTRDLLDIVERLEAKRVGLVILSMGGEKVDTRTPTGRLMVTLLGAIAEFERRLMLDRQREGIAAAKAEGKYKGRAPTAHRQCAEVHRLAGEGMGPTEIARRMGIGRSSVYRILGDRQLGHAMVGNAATAPPRRGAPSP